MNKNTLYCGNCGKYGHVYRKCLSPIISSGIILFKKDEDIKYLLVQRKDTLGFVEFMRGKYNLENIKYINKLFEIMTEKERLLLINNDFDYLWNKLWMKKDNKKYYNEYDNSKKKFNSLKKGIYINNNIISLNTINNNNKVLWYTPEWGIPKGRRNLKETNLNCAIREFEEETGLKNTQYNLIYQIEPIDELFSGSNNIRYKHIYYVANAKNNINNLEIDINNFSQVSEISNIKWFTFDECMNVIRSYSIKKKNVLEKLNKILLN